jgi:hypothetical protein
MTNEPGMPRPAAELRLLARHSPPPDLDDDDALWRWAMATGADTLAMAEMRFQAFFAFHRGLVDRLDPTTRFALAIVRSALDEIADESLCRAWTCRFIRLTLRGQWGRRHTAEALSRLQEPRRPRWIHREVPA